MTQWVWWILLSSLTGSPLAALAILLVVWWLGDRVSFRLLPDPFRVVGRWRRAGALRRTLAANPHDRRARLELANLLLDLRRPGEAAAVLRPNVEAGDEDVHTAFAMGAALARSGAFDAAERVLAVAREADPGFRSGELDLEVGRLRVRRGDFAGAREPLRRLVALRPGTVEGRYWLARAEVGAGAAEDARRLRDEAWREYAAMPRFHRARERPWAWRLRPWRPAVVAAALLVALALAARASAPALETRGERGFRGSATSGEP
jgi:tetratricopeptide (TPR) repeat protein